MDLWARLEAAREDLGWTMRELSRVAGLSTQTHYQVLRDRIKQGGRVEPKTLERICAQLVEHGINARWLLRGEGAMHAANGASNRTAFEEDFFGSPDVQAALGAVELAAARRASAATAGQQPTPTPAGTQTVEPIERFSYARNVAAAVAQELGIDPAQARALTGTVAFDEGETWSSELDLYRLVMRVARAQQRGGALGPGERELTATKSRSRPRRRPTKHP